MGDVLAGIQATWEFETDSVHIRFERGHRTPKLFQALRERRIPHEALASVVLSPGKRGTVVLRLAPRPGADPLMEAAAGQLREENDPYRLVLPADKEALAGFWAQELRAVLSADADRPAERYAVAAPSAPLHFKAYDARASFDGENVGFRWSWTGASSTKWKAGDQSFAVSELTGVEWRSPDAPDGYLRLLPRAEPSRPAQVDKDPAAVVFGARNGPVHESLPFAAAVLASVQKSGRSPVPAIGSARRDPADIAERIRHLGELHHAGLVTDDEFHCKKAELLAEL
ncbi:DUF4429 domain-containing protein [Streptomyces clavuligerus]|uniref:DUF4429 domain-containing protein n=1 Tax=Streptomyces clavuligerus TaxID=1901 RepID=E2Q2T9_STRCL|nr:DUF4429 domain-containing protein [Streptomyces clavuligerus]ANW20361.1 hypothetical protein BB341_20180 [Streptomyces clavuligerus]AXU14988.1 DUF4429 domain-containing protein [Streptomyces clavuligerus]EFG06692.1 Hypothetical protein SCLAV_1617 [Streptomyces clavuligerus]MBY6305037.1 DUF4429 domain-containing protein [Streptomyces clavuligerus]QCS07760.1 DUF4429 domain-containing protein [Streptomyces clavuligerus]